MSRGHLPVFFVLLLAAAAAAQAGPDDVFDAEAPNTLRADQREFILKLEDGRYALTDGHFLDRKAADIAKPLLSNAQVAKLLAASGGGVFSGDGAPPADLAGADAAYQRALARVPKSSPGAMNFDGAAAKSGGIRGPPGGKAGAVSGASSDPGVLQSQLISRLKFAGTAKERAAISEALALILKTKTGRGLARQFVTEGLTSEVSVGPIDSAGETETTHVPPKVTLNNKYVDGDGDGYTRITMAGTLAHELFGHAAERQRSRKAGIFSEAHDHYRGDEMGARLIDWCVQTELAGKVADENPNDYLKDPEKYHRDLLTHDPYYVTTLSVTEMRNPVDTLRGRRKRVAADQAAHEVEVKEAEAWAPRIAHFVAVHKVAKIRFTPAEKEIKEYLDWAYVHRKKITESKAALEEQIKDWTTGDGVNDKIKMIRAGRTQYLANWEATLAARAKALRLLQAEAARREPVSTVEVTLTVEPRVITVSGSKEPEIDWVRLGTMYALDQEKHPEHWKK